MKRLLTVVSLAVAAVSAYAQQAYASRNVDIRAAYLHLNGDHQPTGVGQSLTGPFVWFNLDSNTSVKPAGWNIYNPLAPGWLDASETAFFAARYNNTPAAGSAVNKRTVRYWWVNVANMTDDDFAKLDVALLQVTTPNLAVSPSDREKLRRFVDKGGVLWIDYTYGWLDQTQGGPISFQVYDPPQDRLIVQADFNSRLVRYPFRLASSEVGMLTVGPLFLNQPINNISMAPSDPASEGAGAVAPLMLDIVGNTSSYSRLQPVTRAGQNVPPTTSVANIGDGYVVVTTRGVSEALNRVGSNLNREYFAADPGGQTAGKSVAGQYATAAAKFAVNAISLANQSRQAGAGSRRNYSSFIDEGAPLLQSWAAPYATPSSSATYTAPVEDYRPPVIYKGMSFSVADDRVFCHDVNPRSDVDRDGNPDDGFQDANLGNEDDLIFATSPVASGISSAVCAEIPNPATGVPTDQLLVTTGDGRLLVYPIFDPVTRRCPATEALTPVAALTPGLGGTAGLAPGEVPKAPTVHEGIAYVVDTVSTAGTYIGRVWQVDLRTLQLVRSTSASSNPFVFGGTGNAIQRISSSPTVGYIPILDNSGGLDKVMYLPLTPQASPNLANAGIMSVWLGAKGEHPRLVSEAGGVVTITTRASDQGGLPVYIGNTGDPLSVHVSLVRTDGTVYTAAQMAAVFSGAISQSQGTLSLTLAPAATWPPADLDPENPVRVDYTIDWGAAFPTTIGSVERGRLQFPTPATAQRHIVDGVALSPNGTIYATCSTQNLSPGSSGTNDYLGSFFALREEGRGIFRMVYRWDLYPQHTFSYSGGTQTVPPVLPDNDPVQYLTFGALSLSQYLGGNFIKASFQGAPVVRDGNVFVTVSGSKFTPAGLTVPASALLCFKDDTSSREIKIGRSVSSNAAIVQPDFARSSDPTLPNTFSVLPPASFRIEQEAGDVGSTIRIDNMMTAQRGQIIDSINTSQPIILRESGRPDTIIDPAQLGDRWNPLKWYVILHGMTVRSSAYASGNTVFVSGSSILPQALEFTGSVPGPDGYVTALRTDFDPSVAQKTSQTHFPYDANPSNFVPAQVVADDSRPYMRQVISLDYLRAASGWTTTENDFTNMYPNQLYVWPQVPKNSAENGRTSFDDFKIRVNQCTLRSSTGAHDASYGVVGGDGAVLAWNDQNVFCFRRSDMWVADEGRIAAFDPSGNVIYDSSLQTLTGLTAGDTGGADLTKFDRPTRVYTVGDSNDLLVVDSNQNRVLRMNPNGSVSRNISEFQLDANFVPSGYASGESLKLANPRDAATFVSEVSAANNPFAVTWPEYWVHYLIADQGNDRLIEIVDRYQEDPATGDIVKPLAAGVLLWHSPTAISGKGFAYNSLSRIQVGTGHFVVVAGVGGKAPSRIDSGEPNTGSSVIGDTNPDDQRTSNTGNGGVVMFDDTLPGGYRVFSQFATPAVDHSRVWDFNTGNWSTSTTADIAPRVHVMNNLQSVTASLVPAATLGGTPQMTIMITDGTGVYEVVTDPTNPTVLTTRWMLPNWAFQSMRRTGGVPTSDNPLRFFATYARRLDTDNVVVVNGYSGKTLYYGNNYTGEVLQLDGRLDPVSGLQGAAYVSQGFSTNIVNLGFNTRSIKLRYGPIEGTRGLRLPVFADRR
ncbi:MAG: hypothetical protein JST12_17085 [Armatimonadetes bacterium]|nr:hypothetical protein [Armatimonadota bacterium]MBS1727463.1 hypothetical protein [Armatimonadota bacterium]